jgi:hypothetical protein
VDAGATLDLSNALSNEFAAVSGAGSVRVSSFGALPAISGSIGALQVLGGNACTFTVVAQNNTYVTQPIIAVAGALTVPSNGVVNVVFQDQAKPMRLPLFTYGSVTGTGLSAWTLQTSGAVPPGATLRLVSAATGTSLDIIAKGTVLTVQ